VTIRLSQNVTRPWGPAGASPSAPVALNTAAIQAALDQGGTVVIPPGGTS
jgi:hypothetical protein